MAIDNVARIPVVVPDVERDPRIEAQAASLHARGALEQDPVIARAADEVAAEVRALAIAMIGSGDVEDLEKLLAGVRALPAAQRAMTLARRYAGASAT